ncbi:TRAP transporter small permease [Halalkalibacillus halophilus]|uniref:TRAP transporter small permease n=1 Tax=Halalkalibacillus halophilus TaxID=392827 RepID=UPI000406A415|nr:TRAP transporter small permease [Halalkalibacillus halophilus]
MKNQSIFSNPFFQTVGKIIRAIDKGLLKLEEFILSAAVIVIAVMIAGNVISREIFGPSIWFHAEVSRFAVVIATFMGISYAARKGRHISMSAIYDTVPFKVRKVMAIFIPALTAVALFYLSYVSFIYVQSVFETGRTTTSLEVPLWWMYMFIPLGFFTGAIQFLRNMIVNLTNEEVYIGTDVKDYNDIEPEKRELDDNLQA